MSYAFCIVCEKPISPKYAIKGRGYCFKCQVNRGTFTPPENPAEKDQKYGNRACSNCENLWQTAPCPTCPRKL